MSAPIATPAEAFERVYCVNLDRRPDRWRRFAEGLPTDWPFAAVERFAAIDGRQIKPPPWWHAGRGAWGCYRSHLQLIERCLNEGTESVLLLEDDALFPPDFTPRAFDWLSHVPADWEMIYLGGQHLRSGQHPPIEVAPGVWQPYNVNRTHAWALHGTGLQLVYDHLCSHDWNRSNHIDHHLGRLCQRRQNRIYCPPQWLVGQAAGKSNISGKTPPDRYWAAAQTIGKQSEPPEDRSTAPGDPLLLILGLHSSGSSALAGALWHWRSLWFGQPLVGYWGKGTPAAGGEHKELAAICEHAWPFPSTRPGKRRTWIWRNLRRWVEARQQEARARGAIAAAKYPQLCRSGPQLFNLLGDRLRVLAMERPIDDSIASIQRRAGKTAAPEVLAAHQRWLEEGRQSILSQAADVHRVSYHALLARPVTELQAIAAWLQIIPTPEDLAAAAASIRPELRHV